MSREIPRLYDERAQTMAEYVVVLGVITLAIVASFGALSGAIEAMLGETLDLLDLLT